MHVSNTVAEWLERRRALSGRSIGLVPTMGALHRGHASLVERCRRENEVVVVTIFVNPTQFNDPKDLDRYPRTLEDDLAMLAELGTNEVFVPNAAELYPKGYRFRIEEQEITSVMEGVRRPGFLQGVMTVVLKLLNLVRPNRAYFGEKDYQQLRIISDLVEDFFIPTEIIACPTVREASGLAESSRNRLLSTDARQKAATLFRVLTTAATPREAESMLQTKGFSVDYVEEHWGRRFAAAFLEGVRLIDNVEIAKFRSEVVMQRRDFLIATLAAMTAAEVPSQPNSLWGGPVFDTHLHLRRDPDACFTHIQGCGVTNAILLTRAPDEDKAKDEMAKRPGIFVRSVANDPAQPGADEIIRRAIQGGAVSVGELKYHLALDSPEMRRVYDICAELHVPVMMHIQNFPHFAGELPYNTGYPQFYKVLRAYPRTNFIGHADLFWAHISADVPTDRGYPTGPVKPGGLTDKFLSDFPNLYADMSANSGNNALSRDIDFSRDFIVRHRSKLIFGSDCACSDGRGAGISQGRNPEASRLAGKCVARETLTLLKRLASPEIFRQVTWDNGIRVFKPRFS